MLPFTGAGARATRVRGWRFPRTSELVPMVTNPWGVLVTPPCSARHPARLTLRASPISVLRVRACVADLLPLFFLLALSASAGFRCRSWDSARYPPRGEGACPPYLSPTGVVIPGLARRYRPKRFCGKGGGIGAGCGWRVSGFIIAIGGCLLPGPRCCQWGYSCVCRAIVVGGSAGGGVCSIS